MSANPIRRRAVQAVLVAALSLSILGGCTTGQKPASNYAGAEDNFLDGCIEVAKGDNDKVGDGKQDGATKISSPETYCKCAFNAIEKNVEYSEFKKIQSRMQDEGGALPKSFIEAYQSCDPSEAASS